jgi:hypothetical protein
VKDRKVAVENPDGRKVVRVMGQDQDRPIGRGRLRGRMKSVGARDRGNSLKGRSKNRFRI